MICNCARRAFLAALYRVTSKSAKFTGNESHEGVEIPITAGGALGDS